jgi:hypothetical protein
VTTETTHHTPGPWSFHPTEGANFSIGISGGRHVADCSRNANIPTEEKAANARLIAAAPDLLEAAKAAVENWNHGQPRAFVRETLLAAIAKAQGR